MSQGINKVILVGNVGQDPEVRTTHNGDWVAEFSLATSERWKDRDTGDDQERTEWHTVTVFGKLAEVVEKYVRKGSKLYVEGQIRTESWDDRESGQKRYRTKIICRNLQMLDSRGRDDGNSRRDQDRDRRPDRRPSNDGESYWGDRDRPNF